MSLPVVGITMGDPTGIGPEVIVKALSAETPFQVARPVVFGDQEVLSKTIERVGLAVTIEVFEEVPEGDYIPKKIYLRSVTRLDPASLLFGKPDSRCGEAMVKYIEEAVNWARAGKVNAITTCPINKEAINSAGYPFSGHTELLAHLVKAPAVAMMFLGSRWKIVFVTTHLPLREVPGRVTQDRILSVMLMAEEGMRRHFAVNRPRIAVLGLNPHCGEGGIFGEEERREIIPAIAEARSRGLEVEGPFPSDSFFGLSSKYDFDVVISMYHDQGLIPIKMLDFLESVNFTLGLPFVRTSVGHGTAYDIAGKGLADPSNLIRALLVSANLAKLNKNAAKDI